MEPKVDIWTKSFFDRAIRTNIGRMLRRQYDLDQPLPHGLLTRLMQLNEPQGSAVPERISAELVQSTEDGSVAPKPCNNTPAMPSAKPGVR